MMRMGHRGTALLSALVALALLWPGPVPAAGKAAAEGRKVLVVMSYHPEYTWQRKIREGIDSLLTDVQVEYFSLDTKRDLPGGEARAREALELYREFAPDVVIAADDNAQTLFVLPFLKGKVQTPVVFCGVNHDAARHGYPAANVTGIVEKTHFRESIAYAKVVMPGLRKIATIMKDSPTNRIHADQIMSEKSTYPVEVMDFVTVSTIGEAVAAVHELESEADALLIPIVPGLLDRQGRPMEMTDVLGELRQEWSKPIIGTTRWHVEEGALCAVAKTGQEQGAVAARMALDLLAGMPVSDLPVTENRNGLRMVNLAVAKGMGLKLGPEATVGTEIVVAE